MFVSTPQNLSSLYSDILYQYETSQTNDIDLFINDVTQNSSIGVKKFYSTNCATMNVASIVRSTTYPTPRLRSQGFVPADEIGVARITVSCGDTTTEERQFTLSRQREEAMGLVSSLPTERFIRVGEVDTVRFVVDPTQQLSICTEYSISDDNLDARKPYIDGEREVESFTRSQITQTTDPDGYHVVDFHFVANEISDDWSQSDSYNLEMSERATLVASQNGVEIGRVVYNIIPKHEGAMRLAWISERGSIEHYTFPVVKSYSVDNLSNRAYALTSAYESFEVRCALAQIAGASRVWLTTEQDGSMSYSEVQAADGRIEVSKSRELATVDVNIVING